MGNSGIEKQAQSARELGIAGVIVAATSFMTICSRPLSIFLVTAAVVLCVFGMIKAKQSNSKNTLHIVGLVIAGLRIVVMIFFSLLFNKLEHMINEKFYNANRADSILYDSLGNLKQQYIEVLDSPDSTFYIKDIDEPKQDSAK